MAFQRREVVCQQGEPVATIKAHEIKRPEPTQLFEVSVFRNDHTGRYTVNPHMGQGEKVFLTEEELRIAKERGLNHVEVYSASRRKQ